MQDKQQPKKIKKNLNPNSFYLQPDFLTQEIKKFYETGKMSDDLGRSILQCVDGLQTRFNFRDYTYLDEMKSSAIFHIVKILNQKNFNVDLQTNPFSFFTTISWRVFVQYIKREERNRDTVKKLVDSMYDELMHEPGFSDMYHVYTKNGHDKQFIDTNMLESDEIFDK